ncbi:MAG TPA: LecA/PA-IL family lectin [Panacibacter sp.]|nr:LecA/PA-IL family lectin [Panacibacter sp.]
MYTTSLIFKKIRCRFIDQQTGKPLKGVVASLSVLIEADAGVTKIPFATLISDATGYMSFDLIPLFQLGHISKVFVSAPKFNLLDFDLISSIKLANDEIKEPVLPEKSGDILDNNSEEKTKTPGESLDDAVAAIKRKLDLERFDNSSRKRKTPCIVFPIYLSKPSITQKDECCSDCQTQTLISIQSPDISDYEASLYSFVSPAKTNIGSNSCENLMPTTLPVQQYHFYKIIVKDNKKTERDGMESGPGSNDASLKKIKIVDITAPIQDLETTEPEIKFCEILDYKQSWFSLGHSLGEIKYSLPLAPGESTQLAVIEWSRQDSASRKDGVTATEFLDHDSRRERSIEDTVKAALSENQDGWSMMGGSSAAVSIPVVPGVDLSVNAAFGGGVSHSSGNRNVEGDSLQDLHDRVQQSSAYIRSLTSTVIVQSSQAESNTLQTRRVANHNHCHALTIQYYEVLRHYSLKTEFKGKRNAVLIPFSIFRFTEDIALRFRQAITPMLLDASLKDCFDALLRLKMPELYPTRYATVIVKTDKNKNNAEVFQTGLFVKKGDVITFNATGEISFSVDQNTHQPASIFGPDGSKTPPDPAIGQNWFCGLTINMFSLGFKIGGGVWQQGGSLTTAVADSDGEIFLVANDINTYSENTGSWTVNVIATTNGSMGQIVQGNTGNIKTDEPKTEKRMLKKELLVKGDDEEGVDSEIEIKVGDKIIIDATGVINFFGEYGYRTPDGRADNGATGEKANLQKEPDLKFIADGLTKCSLIYKIGDNSWKQGGKKVEFISTQAGKLLFNVNDIIGWFKDNQTAGDRTSQFDLVIQYPSDESVVASNVKQPLIKDPTTTTSSDTDIVPAIKDKLCSLKLLTHLNSNQGYYNRIVWMMMDSVERRLYLESSLSDFPEILTVMDDMPLAVTGNSLAFPCDLPEMLPANDAIKRTEPGEIVESIVCFPTRGLFAEAQLGHCNSCEERDITRMWDWNEMTTETPPEIAGIAPGPKSTTTTLTPTQLPGNVIQITTPQNAPDPTGLANALTLLGNGNAFRDMSGLNQVSGLLGQLSKESNESHIKAMATKAQQKVDDIRNNQGNNSVNPSTPGQTPTGRNDQLQMAKKTIELMKENGLSDDEIKQYLRDSAKKNDLLSGGAITSIDDTNGSKKKVDRPSQSAKFLRKHLEWVSEGVSSIITSDDDKLADAVGDAVFEIAKTEVDNAVDAIPLGKAFRLAVHYSLIFANGVDMVMIASRKDIQNVIDDAAQFSQDNGLSDADIKRIQNARSFMVTAVADTRKAILNGFEMVVADILSEAGNQFIKSLQHLASTITGNICKKLAEAFHIDKLFLSISEKIGDDIPKLRVELYKELANKLAGLLVLTFVKKQSQMERLQELIKNTAGSDPAVGMLQSLLELGLSKKLSEEIYSTFETGPYAKNPLNLFTFNEVIKYECYRAAKIVINKLKENGWSFGSYPSALTDYEIKVDKGNSTILLPSHEVPNLEFEPEKPEGYSGHLGQLESNLSTDEFALAGIVDALNIGVIIESRDYQADIDEGKTLLKNGVEQANRDAIDATSALIKYVARLKENYKGTALESQANATLLPVVIPAAVLSGPSQTSIPNNYA